MQAICSGNNFISLISDHNQYTLMHALKYHLLVSVIFHHWLPSFHVARSETCAGLKDFNAEYKLMKKLGKGVHGTGIEVLNLLTNNTGVLKINKGMPMNGTDKTIKYANLTRLIPNLMRLEDIVCYKGRIMPVWERCQGSKLDRELLSESCVKQSNETVWNVVKHLANATASLMLNGFVHTDLCPKNVIFDARTNRLCLIDLDLQNVGFPTKNMTALTRFISKQVRTWRGVKHDPALGTAYTLASSIGLTKLPSREFYSQFNRNPISLIEYIHENHFNVAVKNLNCSRHVFDPIVYSIISLLHRDPVRRWHNLILLADIPLTY